MVNADAPGPGHEHGALKREGAALLIIHGMGQQARFSTLDGLTRGLFDAATAGGNQPTIEHVVTSGAG